MNPEVATSVLDLLATERAALAAAVARVPVPLQATPPGPQRWSVVDVLEHLARVETGITRLLTLRGREPEPDPLPAGVRLEDARMTPERVARMRNRAERIEAPERIRPSGATEPRAAWEALEAARQALLAAVAAAEPGSLDGVVHEHPVLGPLVLRGWIEFVAHHEARHTAQIQEIADALGMASDAEVA